MKRSLMWLIGAGGVVVGLALFLRGQGQRVTGAIVEAAKEKPAQTQPASAAQAATQGSVGQAAASAEKIVYTFGDDAKMQDFTKLWQQRQGVLLRMSVLQTYWSEEQAALAKLNNQVATDYKLDVTKNYFLDGQRRVLIEREVPPAPPSAQPTVQPSQPAPSKAP